MIGKVIGGLAGQRLAKDMSGISGTGGALLGIGAATLLRRLSPLAVIAFAIGGYAAKKRSEKRGSVRDDGDSVSASE